MSIFNPFSSYVSLDSLRAFRPGSLAGSLTLSVAYGLNIESESDRFYSPAEEALTGVDTAMMPGAFLVDALPFRMSFH